MITPYSSDPNCYFFLFFIRYHFNMNTKVPCPYCSSLEGFIYVQSHYQCLTCKRVVDDCCGGETVQCAVPIESKKETVVN